jgi:hypothetical protein
LKPDGELVTSPLPLPDFVAVTFAVAAAAATLIVAVPRFESVEPSLAANVNESIPE